MVDLRIPEWTTVDFQNGRLKILKTAKCLYRPWDLWEFYENFRNFSKYYKNRVFCGVSRVKYDCMSDA